ncbi:MAG: hypothetical protein A3A65_02810 [Candidatus Chisholmbacteria bacterium RIFCSPLOWO2_01_FULL_49_14]|uniref:Uncharacterized protein n=1 Tax=Candidatus Chisholmbacteria bacterium RIFCSPLOWO2_01_FULL_49_14 TaxID=1797593 RepID=A0A1G1VZP6_9BACT|nr:MAG: hypothetical protein A3A65_02810 [Candidatus Chisholmbacteria bacterium RIFCSPLOWO2_01_FULL_49_14]
MGYFKEALVGTGWMGMLRGITRGVGFLKIAILARLLTPEQFGIFGIAGITLALLETFTETGLSLALVQQKEDIEEYISTAWVISLLRGVVIGIIILIASSLVTGFFHQPQAFSLLSLIALVPVIRGAINPAAVNFVKKLDFGKEFRLRSGVLAADAVASLIFAFALRNATAIVIGMLAGAVMEVVLTFTMTTSKPKLVLVRSQVRKLLGFGKWVTLGGIMGYLSEQFDDIMVGRILGTTSLGVYQMAFKLSVLPSAEIAETLSKVTFPVYTRIAEDHARLKRALSKTVSVNAAIALPACMLIILFPQLIIRISLGEQWLAAALPLQILAFYGLTRALSQAPSSVLYAAGRPDIAAKLRSLQFILMAVIIIPLIRLYGLPGAAIAVVMSAIVTQVPLWIAVRKFLY